MFHKNWESDTSDSVWIAQSGIDPKMVEMFLAKEKEILRLKSQIKKLKSKLNDKPKIDPNDIKSVKRHIGENHASKKSKT